MKIYWTAGFVSLMTAVILCTGCGKESSNDTAKPTGDNVLEVIQSNGEPRVGMEVRTAAVKPVYS